MTDEIHNIHKVENTGRMLTTGLPDGQSVSVHSMTPHSYKMTFKDTAGKTAEIKLEDGKVVYSGELPIDETADLFFRNVLMAWRNFGQDEDYRNARVSALEAGYTENDRLASVIRDLADMRDNMRLVLETIRYETRQETSERLQRIQGYAERTLGITKP